MLLETGPRTLNATGASAVNKLLIDELGKLVDPQFRSWNQIDHWLRRIVALKTPSGWQRRHEVVSAHWSGDLDR